MKVSAAASTVKRDSQAGFSALMPETKLEASLGYLTRPPTPTPSPRTAIYLL